MPLVQSLHQVYPRVCGGTARCPTLMSVWMGLSPRVRGNLTASGLHLFEVRSIPACAGEPDARAATWQSPRVYPRVCGGTRSR